LREAGLTPEALGTAEGFAAFPIMSRRDVQDAGADLFCREIPQTHGGIEAVKSFGSAGEPVIVQRTGVSRFDWYAATLARSRFNSM
jgi:phenylacetate-CoA ligase